METPNNVSINASTVPSSFLTKTYSLFHSLSEIASIKLDRSNYLVWESVVLPLIKENLLISHIDGTGVTLPRFINGSSSIDYLLAGYRTG